MARGKSSGAIGFIAYGRLEKEGTTRGGDKMMIVGCRKRRSVKRRRKGKGRWCSQKRESKKKEGGCKLARKEGAGYRERES